MPTDAHDIDQTSVVALGRHFKVAKLLPQRLIEAGVLTPADAQQVQVNVLLPDEVLVFETQFVIVNVEKTKISITSKSSAPIPQKVRDLAAVLLAELDEPVLAIGVNRDLHFQIATDTKYKELRDKLINVAPWGPVLKNPLVRSMLLQCDRYDRRNGQVNIKIETSALLQQGVYLQVNDHIDFPGGHPSLDLAGFLTEIWASATENSNSIVSQVRAFSQ